jgi:hypothetical protein
MRATVRVLVTPAKKNASVDLGAMPADGFDAAAKKFGTSARPGGSSPRQWMDNTPAVRASEETNQNKPGTIVSVVGTNATCTTSALPPLSGGISGSDLDIVKLTRLTDPKRKSSKDQTSFQDARDRVLFE